MRDRITHGRWPAGTVSPFETLTTKADQADLFADTAYSGNNARNELGQNTKKERHTWKTCESSGATYNTRSMAGRISVTFLKHLQLKRIRLIYADTSLSGNNARSKLGPKYKREWLTWKGMWVKRCKSTASSGLITALWNESFTSPQYL